MIPDPLANADTVTGVILAGGRGSRLGGIDKGLAVFRGRPLIESVLERLAPQVDGILISANRNQDRYRRYGYPVISDLEPGFQGPLTGILSAMLASRTGWIQCVPCDSPQCPSDLVARMQAAIGSNAVELVMAADGERLQPLFVLLRVSLAARLQADLKGGTRSAVQWMLRQTHALADFSDQTRAFLNINTPLELTGSESPSHRMDTPTVGFERTHEEPKRK
ncbi:hypothetical protein CKO25_16705 [Thiocapsa imhoffii]|uniref:Molybdenum cofactor guanylyltransferase n=1 Tax=Thiocapsa imhoffii TaxID=382777 RepID=A0A9X0WKM9_9GAMM|nr:molybdenum cofactor guanylyltransferase MobA [Thiocapsa imhoffii]MBK1646255.1 hypothetical protein [Thiocapsa imhoffii]